MTTIATAYVGLEFDKSKLNSQINSMAVNLNKAIKPLERVFNRISVSALAIGFKAVHSFLKTSSTEAVNFKASLSTLSSAMSNLGSKILQLSVGGRTLSQWIQTAAAALNSVTTDQLQSFLNKLIAAMAILKGIQGLTITIKGLEALNKVGAISNAVRSVPGVAGALGLGVVGAARMAANASGKVTPDQFKQIQLGLKRGPLISKATDIMSSPIERAMAKTGLAVNSFKSSLAKMTPYITTIGGAFLRMSVIIALIAAIIWSITKLIDAFSKSHAKNALEKFKKLYPALVVFNKQLDRMGEINNEVATIINDSSKAIEKLELSPNIKQTPQEMGTLFEAVNKGIDDTASEIKKIKGDISRAKGIKIAAERLSISEGKDWMNFPNTPAARTIALSNAQIKNAQEQLKEVEKANKDFTEKRKEIIAARKDQLDADLAYTKSISKLQDRARKLLYPPSSRTFETGTVGAEELRSQAQQALTKGLNDEETARVEALKVQEDVRDINQEILDLQETKRKEDAVFYNTVKTGFDLFRSLITGGSEVAAGA